MKRSYVAVLAVLGIVAVLGASTVYARFDAVPALVSQSATGALTGSATTEVLVLTTATQLPQTATAPRGRSAIEIQNLGPNSIFCAFSSATAVVNKARRIQSGESWAIDAKSHIPIYCIAATANQVTGAATIVSELVNN